MRIATLAVERDAFVPEIKRRDRGVRRLLIVFVMIASAIASDAIRIINLQPPSRHVEKVDPVIADLAVAPMPAPMPLIMHQIVNKWTLRRRPLPHVVIKPVRHRCRLSYADRAACIVVPSPREPHVADVSFVDP